MTSQLTKTGVFGGQHIHGYKDGKSCDDKYQGNNQKDDSNVKTFPGVFDSIFCDFTTISSFTV